MNKIFVKIDDVGRLGSGDISHIINGCENEGVIIKPKDNHDYIYGEVKIINSCCYSLGNSDNYKFDEMVDLLIPKEKWELIKRDPYRSLLERKKFKNKTLILL